MKTFDTLCNELEERTDTNTKFDELAEYLFNQCYLETSTKPTKKFYFTEIEFYYESDNHPDKFRHNNDCQKERGTIYWHRSGIDITIGNGEKIKGGILIRGIKGDNTEGPCKLLSNAILPALGICNVRYGQGGTITYRSAELKNKKDLLKFKSDIDTNFDFKIEKNIRKNLRKGLGKGCNFSKEEETLKEDFRNKKYNYSVKE